MALEKYTFLMISTILNYTFPKKGFGVALKHDKYN